MTKKDRWLDGMSIVISIVCLIMVGLLTVSVMVFQKQQLKDRQEINGFKSDIIEFLEEDIKDEFTRLENLIVFLNYDIIKLENRIKSLEEKELDSQEILTLENQIQELINERNLIERVYSKLFNEYLEDFDINDFEIWLKTNHADLWKEVFIND